MLFKHHVFMEEAGDGDGGGGGGSTDRGDFVDNNDDAEELEARRLAEEAAAKEAEEKKAAEEGEKKAAEEEGDEKDQPRDKDGKFAKRGNIPLDRHEKVLNKEREARQAAENKLKELQSQISQVDRNADIEKLDAEIEALEKQHAKYILDGDDAKAAAAMREIRMKERQISVSNNQQMTAQAKDQAREEIRIDMAIEHLEDTYPEFNQDSESFDKGLVEMVLALQRHKIEQGLPPSKALLSAASEVMERMHPAEKSTEKPLDKAKETTDRKAAQVKKNLDTAASQSPNLKDSGKDSDKLGSKGGLPDPRALTFDEFSALPESTKAKMRGDVL